MVRLELIVAPVTAVEATVMPPPFPRLSVPLLRVAEPSLKVTNLAFWVAEFRLMA